jgi:integrase/recombinase XerD
MQVQKVASPGARLESWTVLGDDDVPVEPIERYLAHLSAVERSPNTVKAYAHDLKDFFVFLGRRGLDWREVRLEDIGEFVAWLRLPPAGRSGKVAVLPSVEPALGAATINRKLSAVSAFYQHQARHGVDLGELLVAWRPGGRGSFKPFLHHISKGRSAAAAGRLGEDAGEAAPSSHRRRGSDDPGCVPAAPGSAVVCAVARERDAHWRGVGSAPC